MSNTHLIPNINVHSEEIIEPKELYTVIRNVETRSVNQEDISRNSLKLDSFIISEDTGEIMSDNKFVDNNNFNNADEINAYLRYWGKIPSFLEIKKTESRGYGVYTTCDIEPDTFLGRYEGIIRYNDVGLDTSQLYLFTMYDFLKNKAGFIDAQNIMFSNFARFINHNDEPNCVCRARPYAVYISTTDKGIKKGEELFITYGEEYWEECNIQKV